ncbi:hypothetical protein [uncultured Methylobacterium sp.]|jgi:predicted DNA-binding transcriptional regulator YafY|uniref:hypothetical protein n=1 Tax=uncultured Methylobacterium sp. TaxID=157278 RepID=UPI00262F65EB|nr:hypothetical protein [uncultured Methylobacterium sp.]
MFDNGFFPLAEAPTGASPAPSAGPEPPAPTPFVERQDGAWRVLPLEGRFELVYEDGNGAWSVRRLAAHELKIGPGRVLVGGTDRDRDGYRGFRADRIHRLTDRDSGERVERNILDWLTRRAEATRKARAAALRRAARTTRRASA